MDRKDASGKGEIGSGQFRQSERLKKKWSGNGKQLAAKTSNLDIQYGNGKKRGKKKKRKRGTGLE